MQYYGEQPISLYTLFNPPIFSNIFHERVKIYHLQTDDGMAHLPVVLKTVSQVSLYHLIMLRVNLDQSQVLVVMNNALPILLHESCYLSLFICLGSLVINGIMATNILKH